jgi:hypothetical protein
MKVVRLPRSPLERIAFYLAKLIGESEDPRAEMLEAAGRLEEAGIWEGRLPNPLTPRSFVERVILNNGLLQESLSFKVIYWDPRHVETASELVTYILPTDNYIG